MEVMEVLIKLSEAMLQAAAVLGNEEVDENPTTTSSSSSKRSSTFLNTVALGNVGAGKSAVLNSLIGRPVPPTGENGATPASFSIDLQRDASVNCKTIVLQAGSKNPAGSLQYTLSKGSGKSCGNEIYSKLRTGTEDSPRSNPSSGD